MMGKAKHGPSKCTDSHRKMLCTVTVGEMMTVSPLGSVSVEMFGQKKRITAATQLTLSQLARVLLSDHGRDVGFNATSPSTNDENRQCKQSEGSIRFGDGCRDRGADEDDMAKEADDGEDEECLVTTPQGVGENATEEGGEVDKKGVELPGDQ